MSVRTDIMNVLRSPNCRRISFNLGQIRIFGSDYATIAQCIMNGHIQVVQSNAIPSTKAAYDRAYNYFAVGSSPSRNLIVHESTHALNDWHKRSLSDVDDECCAYIAQMMFLFIEKPNLQNALKQSAATQRASQTQQQCLLSDLQPWINPQICNTAAIAQAGYLAIDLLANRAMSPGKLQDLRNALERDPNTRPSRTCQMRSYNGILRTTIPASELQKLGGQLVTN
jgi:hypothetical protein